MNNIRNVQTRVKHKILRSYLDAWAGIIVNGLASVAASRAAKALSFQAGLVYVDGFSWRGRYDGDASEVVLSGSAPSPRWGSPIIGVQALDDAKRFARGRGFDLETRVILVEEHADEFRSLQESLQLAGYEARTTTNPATLQLADGQIAAIQGDFLGHLYPIVSLTRGAYLKAFYLLDPYGPKGIPYDAVARVVSQPTADVMINFPYLDLHKKAGILGRWLAGEVRPGDQGLLANYDSVFGTSVWRQIVERVLQAAPPEQRGELVEEELSELYLERLRDADPTLAVKRIRLQFPDRDRTIYYLYLTTHDATGALAMNEILWKAHVEEGELRWLRSQAAWVRRSHEAGQLTLFDAGLDLASPPASTKEERDTDIAKLADHIHAKFRGKAATLLDVCRFLADTDVFAGEVRQALTHLKRSGRVQYGRVAAHEQLRF